MTQCMVPLHVIEYHRGTSITGDRSHVLKEWNTIYNLFDFVCNRKVVYPGEQDLYMLFFYNDNQFYHKTFQCQ